LYRIIFLFFFLSGFTSLVFEVLWERMLMHIFGSTSFALSTLLTAFMGGLALGSYLGGRLADKIDRPLLAYGVLEGCIGVYALAVPFLLDLLPSVYNLIFDQFIGDFYVFSLLRFVAVFAILVVPTTLMGATLPIVSQWVSRHQKMFQGGIGLLYGINTFGACIGALLAGFVVLPNLGLSTTNTIFALSNFALCALVFASAKLGLSDLKPGEFIDREQDVAELDAIDGSSDTSEAIPPKAVWLVLVMFALAGGISMSYQVLWTRAYVIILGSSTYSFTVILTAFLVGLASGSAAISPFLKRIRRPVFWLGLTQFGVAVSATAAFFVLDQLPVWLFERLREDVGGTTEIYAYYFFLVGVVVLIPTFLQGMSFPLVIRTAVNERTNTGKLVGNAYAFNTAGSILGSFAAGFVLMPWLGLNTAIAVVIAINLVVAATLSGLEAWLNPKRRRIAAVVLAGLVGIGGYAMAPRIDPIALTRGMFRVYWARELFTPEKLANDSPELVFYEDGLTATTTVEKRGELVTLKANGKPEASDGADMATQVLVGLMPFVVRSGNPDVEIRNEEAVMIGYGSGVTAGGSLQWPLKSLEVIEIEGAMLEASKFFNHVNHRPLEDERTEVIESDGRNYLEYTDKTYDVIVSEPSNPWIAGVSALFTVEHFRRAKSHLKPGGVFSQWVQLYEMRPINVRRILATFLEVFPHVQAFSSMPKGTDLILMGSDEPIPLPPGGYERAWEIDSVRDELERVGIHHPDHLYGFSFMSQSEIAEFADGARLNTDDNGLLEFEAPKDLILYKKGEKFFAERYHKQDVYGDLRPYLDGWPDKRTWTPERIGSMARAQWLGGKNEFAAQILDEAGFGSIDQLPEPLAAPYDALEEVRLVLHAAALNRDEAMVRTWPVEGSDLHRLLIDAVSGEKHNQAMTYLESQGAPPRGGYDGEKGLLYAYLLTERRYYRHALEQLEGLEKDANPQIVKSLPYRLLKGFVESKRLHFYKSYQAYLEAGKSLVN
jgi:spermidine synthase